MGNHVAFHMKINNKCDSLSDIVEVHAYEKFQFEDCVEIFV